MNRQDNIIKRWIVGERGGRLSQLAIGIITIMACSACGVGCNNSNSGDKYIPSDSVVVTQDDSISIYHLIADNCAGPFHIGAVISDKVEGFMRTESSEDKATLEGKVIEIPIYTYEIGNEGWVKVTPLYDVTTGIVSDKIGEIYINSDLFLTDKGIGAMSSIKAFSVAYPDFTIQHGDEDMPFVAETPQLHNIQFLLDDEYYIGPDDYRVSDELSISDFKDRACFTAIRIVNN